MFIFFAISCIHKFPKGFFQCFYKIGENSKFSWKNFESFQHNLHFEVLKINNRLQVTNTQRRHKKSFACKCAHPQCICKMMTTWNGLNVWHSLCLFTIFYSSDKIYCSFSAVCLSRNLCAFSVTQSNKYVILCFHTSCSEWEKCVSSALRPLIQP